MFRYYFRGTAEPVGRKNWPGSWLLSDYVILYFSYAQRGLPAPEVVDYLESLEPEYVASIGGTDYAKVYRVPALVTREPRPISNPSALALGDELTLLGYDLPTRQVESGGRIKLVLYWQSQQPLQTDYAIHLRLVNGVQHAWGEQDGGPLWGMMPTSRWHEDMTITDPRELEVLPGTPPGSYQIQVEVYDPGTLRSLKPEGGAEALLLGPVEVLRGLAAGPPEPQVRHEATLDNQIQLLGYDLQGQPQPGSRLHLTLFWHALTEPLDDYTVFVHVVASDGQIWAQRDNQPVTNFYPTSLWTEGEYIRDQYDLEVPGDAPDGPYTLRLGMYLAETDTRLPVLDDSGRPTGDSILVTTGARE